MPEVPAPDLRGRAAARCGDLMERIVDEHGWQIAAKKAMTDGHLFVRVGPTDAPAEVE